MNKQQAVAIVLIGLGLIAGSFLVHKNQQLVQRSKVREGLGSIVVEQKQSMGDVKAVDFIIKTGDFESGNEARISSVSIKAKIGDENEEISFVNDLHESVTEIIPAGEYLESGDWLFPVNTIYEENGQYYLEFVAVNTSSDGYATSTPSRLCSVYVKSSSVEPPGITLDSRYTKMMSKDKPVVNILP